MAIDRLILLDRRQDASSLFKRLSLSVHVGICSGITDKVAEVFMRLFYVPLLRCHLHFHSCAALCAPITVAVRRVDLSRQWALIEGLLA